MSGSHVSAKESLFIRLARVIPRNGLRFPLVPRAVLGSPNWPWRPSTGTTRGTLIDEIAARAAAGDGAVAAAQAISGALSRAGCSPGKLALAVLKLAEGVAVAGVPHVLGAG